MAEKRTGFISLSSVLFYSMSFLILLAIPVTIILVRSEKQQVTQASRGFNNPPQINVNISPTAITPGQKVKAQITLDFANWYNMYFVPAENDISNAQDLLNAIKSRYIGSERMSLLHEGSSSEEFELSLLKSGYIVVVGFQLKNYVSDFKSADIACSWDNTLYMYRERMDLFGELFGKGQNKDGEWSPLQKCTNSGPIKVDIIN